MRREIMPLIACLAAILISTLLPIRSVTAQVKVNVDLPEFLKFNKEEAPMAKSVIAVFTLKGTLGETPPDDAMAIFGGGSQAISLRQLVSRMNAAADDPNVKAVVILDEGGQLGIAQLEEIRQAVAHLRDSGRDVYVNTDSLTMGKYVLFCGATHLSVVPTGDVWLTGLFAEQPYLRGLLNKINVTPDFLTCGAYKSAAELFMREGPSPEADSMTNWLIDGIYGDLVNLIAKGRNVSTDKAKAWIDGGPYTAEKARDAGLIDAVEHREQFQAMLKTKYGIDVTFDRRYGEKEQSSVDLSSPMGIFKLWGELLSGGAKKSGSEKDAIGIVYVDGTIQVGSRDPSPFSGSSGAMSSDIRKALDTAANDDSIKAVVLRIDSPGGSATASEIILAGTKRVKSRKPLIVSMGNVAGSGGYYVACGSDTIFADESTITGSIGVVGGKFATTEAWKKIGVTWKPYQRGQNAGLLSSYAVFSPDERKRMQGWMDEIYGVFKGHVVEVRGQRLKKPIDEIAGGRVYTGKQALELGLVDKMGTLQDAIVYAAEQAHVTDYDVRVVPEPKSFIEQLFAGMSGNDDDKGRLLQMGTPTLWDLALPHLAGMDPQRVAAIKEAFTQLRTMQSEGVILMTPPLVISK